jgi:hypothetical protein
VTDFVFSTIIVKKLNRRIILIRYLICFYLVLDNISSAIGVYLAQNRLIASRRRTTRIIIIYIEFY